MSWNPGTRKLETLVEHAQARVPAAVTAKALNVDVEELREFARRLEIGGAYVKPESQADDCITTPKSMMGATSPFRLAIAMSPAAFARIERRIEPIIDARCAAERATRFNSLMRDWELIDDATRDCIVAICSELFLWIGAARRR